MIFCKIMIGDFFKKSILFSVSTLIMLAFVSLFSATDSYTMGGKTNPSIDTLANELATSNNLDKEYTAALPALEAKESLNKDDIKKKNLGKFYLGNIKVGEEIKKLIEEGNNYHENGDYDETIKKLKEAAKKLSAAGKYQLSAKLHETIAINYYLKEGIEYSYGLINSYLTSGNEYKQAKMYEFAGHMYNNAAAACVKYGKADANNADDWFTLAAIYYMFSGEMYGDVGLYKESMKMYKLSVVTYTFIKNFTKAKYAMKLANMYEFHAEKISKKVLKDEMTNMSIMELEQSIKALLNAAAMLDNAASVYGNINNFEKKQEVHKKAEDMKKYASAMSDKKHEITTYLTLAKNDDLYGEELSKKVLKEVLPNGSIIKLKAIEKDAKEAADAFDKAAENYEKGKNSQKAQEMKEKSAIMKELIQEINKKIKEINEIHKYQESGKEYKIQAEESSKLIKNKMKNMSIIELKQNLEYAMKAADAFGKAAVDFEKGKNFAKAQKMKENETNMHNKVTWISKVIKNKEKSNFKLVPKTIPRAGFNKAAHFEIWVKEYYKE